jgi:predicted MPP superfamily phosphohydrolase
VEVSHYEIASERWPAGAPPLRIAYASDFHAGPTTHPELWRDACDALQATGAELLLLGGDFAALGARDADPVIRRLGELHFPLGRFAVLGNHDYAFNAAYIGRQLEKAGIDLITNRNVALPAPWVGVWICGLDDWGYGDPDASAALGGADGFRVVLMHAPSGVLDLDGERWEVALCGHTHGGQIALPGGRPLVSAHGPLSRHYSRGRFDLASGGTLLVSRGVGASGVPFRLFSVPEIIVCTVRSAAAGDPVA